MRARAGRDAVVLGQNVRHFARVHVADVERRDRRALAVKVAVERHARNVPHALDKAAQQRRFVCVDRADPGLLQKVERGEKSRDAVAVERPRLEARRHLRGLRLGIRLHARAADLPRGNVYAFAHAQSARALRAHERLVPGEAQHIDLHFFHVDGQHARALRGVHEEHQSVRVRKLSNARKIKHIARQIRGVRADDGTGIGAQKLLKIRIVDVPLPVRGNKAQRNALLPFQPVERPQHGVVLQVRRNDVVAAADAAVNGDIQRFGRVAGESDMIRPLTAKERGELAARVVNDTRGGKRAFMCAARTVSKAVHGLHHRVDDLRRLPQRGRRIVEIDHLHGRTMRSAPLIFSTMTYIFVTSPTASFSLRS